MTKGLLSSKTVWMAFLIFGASILKVTGIVDVPVDEGAAWIGIAIGAIQFVLRIVTKSEIVIK